MFGELSLDKQGNVAAVQPPWFGVIDIFNWIANAGFINHFVGKLVKRFGIRRVTVAAGLVFGLSAFIVSRLHSPSQLWLYYIFAGVTLGRLTVSPIWRLYQTRLSGSLRKRALFRAFRLRFMVSDHLCLSM